jgi:hypothetical protein
MTNGWHPTVKTQEQSQKTSPQSGAEGKQETEKKAADTSKPQGDSK